jgi:hypothetical protein
MFLGRVTSDAGRRNLNLKTRWNSFLFACPKALRGSIPGKRRLWTGFPRGQTGVCYAEVAGERCAVRQCRRRGSRSLGVWGTCKRGRLHRRRRDRTWIPCAFFPGRLE